MTDLHLVDTHAHMDFDEFAQDLDGYVSRANQAGVKSIISIGSSSGLESAPRAIAVAERFTNVWATAGVHPNEANIAFDIDALEKFAQHPKVVAIGETGLDYYRDHATPQNQDLWFRAQIELAIKLNKPIIVHCRQTAADCLKVLKETNAQKVGGVFHCFSETAEFAAELRKLNFLVSFTGIITFKNATALREAAQNIPVEQMLVETDAPYLAPEPYRGKTCESAYTLETAKTLAKIKGLGIGELAKITTQNAKNLFKI